MLHRRASWFTAFVRRRKHGLNGDDMVRFDTFRNLRGSFTFPRGRNLLLASCAAVVLAGCNAAQTLTPGETLHQGYVVDQEMLDMVPVGSSREQVLLALGSPSTTATFDNEVFYYVSQTRHRPVAFMNPRVVDQRVLAVYFGDDGRVTNIADYGLQDGRVFDFISRTTPTASRDRNFLQQLITGVARGGASTGSGPGVGF
jgi:outer membrane protein assembly factor BamE (lipoprotein component of BamABCDE complex)